MHKQFIPNSFIAPTFLETDQFYFVVLEDSVAELDFEAVMSSQQRLRSIFGPKSEWPKSNMTLEENIESLKIHKQEFQSRQAFAYSVLNASKDKCLGSVYIDPSRSPNYDCELYFWVRNDSTALESELYKTISTWFLEKWPFSRVAFPGRGISWEEWTKELR
ncbi:hypothetical protein RGQ13_02485 [Thalassotalea psychrophila]|uniref:Uncharacterized protein n=1 Tax=Thalassotalea psychrophila TaxID=3065647 RepID=A0ABY9TVI8_9GAMM|nr:hypothetical protein RGQ13_02485 [Colwelliaceae bacterium SQ149]